MLGRQKTTGINSQYEEVEAGDIPANLAGAKRLVVVERIAKIATLTNDTNQPVVFYVVTPQDSTRKMNKFLSLAGGRSYTLELASNNAMFEAGIEIWVHYKTAAPTSGFISYFSIN